MIVVDFNYADHINFLTIAKPTTYLEEKNEVTFALF